MCVMPVLGEVIRFRSREYNLLTDVYIGTHEPSKLDSIFLLLCCFPLDSNCAGYSNSAVHTDVSDI